MAQAGVSKRRGTQSIERAVVLLKELSSRGSFGWRLSDLAQRCEIDPGTVHRILAYLSEERLVQRRPSDRHYLPGPLLFELGLSQAPLVAFQSACDAPLRRLAARYSAVSSVYMRSGTECVCSGSIGSSPTRAVASPVGRRLPLVASAIGLAILVALPPDERKRIIADNLRRVAHLGAARTEAVKMMIKNAERCGYGIHTGEIVPGVNAYSVAIANKDGIPFASLGLSGAAAALPASRAARIIADLRAEARNIELDSSWGNSTSA